ncbi:hypothetical protein FVR03_17425 [Pontibacter qinzhouensis]|uniref:SatD family (SatD) n=1 Tax=Pontibacter qinzhouensis TaxID=2603253 RepID=A0A5C8JG74_9BACT|nr:SatD family protein [Pontibacter qinzhouensis]TXK36588.1 hypothetical protein FVR03_17425 [Pontibacter qinzhouensis]
MKSNSKNYYILMADIIGSSRQPGGKLMEAFKAVVEEVNKKCHYQLLSPLTITLGDEFQGVVADLAAGLQVMVALEELIVLHNKPFSLRYVINYGPIDTPVNTAKAHAMLGNGLTQAREMLEQVKKDKGNRYKLEPGNTQQHKMLERALLLYQSLVDAWKPADSLLISTFLQNPDYKVVAGKLGKVRSLMWKREKSLKIKEYIAARELLHLIAAA